MVIAASGMEPSKAIDKKPETMEEIIAAYKEMATLPMDKGDSLHAKQCLAIAEDIEMLRKRGLTPYMRVTHQAEQEEKDNAVK